MPALKQVRTIETLRGMLDELCSPDLTLGRARVLRRRLAQLLEALKTKGEEAGDGSAVPGE